MLPVAEVKVGAAGIAAEFDRQWISRRDAFLDFRDQFILG